MQRTVRVRPQTERRAFTLVELLVVIAILGILAGLLVPVINAARRKARLTEAQNDIHQIGTAITAYSNQWGYVPPDQMPGPADLNTPNECLVLFLGSELDPAESDGNIGLGDQLSGNVNKKARIYATIKSVPYHEFKRKRLNAYDGGNFYSFMDPWGLPYFYNAKGGAYGDPQHKSDYDLFSVGPNGKTAQGSLDVRAMFDSGTKISPAEWATILSEYRSGNDVDASKGGNPYTSGYSDNDADDVNNF